MDNQSGSTFRYTTDPPTEPGWYWCRNSCDEPPGVAEFVCHVFRREDGLWCSWMTAPAYAEVLHESCWSEEALWFGPLTPPTVE